MSFENLGLMPELLRAVRDEGYEHPTPVQEQAIPAILEGRDLLAGAQTGTGKTAGFVLPILQLLAPSANSSASPARHPIRCLILTPTRELCMQIEESVRTYGRHLPLRSTSVYGGVNINPQVKALRSGVEILVATPGRLLDHYGQNNLNFSHLDFLVLDEADRMLDMGFIRDIRKILALLPTKRQNLLFSATFSDEIRDLAGAFLKNPVFIDVARRNAPTDLVEQIVHPVDRDRKRALLSHLIRSQRLQQVLVFCRTKHGANRLSEQLETDGIASMAIHGNKSQPQRIKALEDFKAGRITVLVATDIAARGLDIDQLPHVVNYELPHVPEDYVHRIGRTGRAGTEGKALSLVCVDEARLLKDIEKLLKRDLPSEVVPGFVPDPTIKAEPIVQGRGGQRQGGPRPGGARRPGSGGGRPSASRARR
ncbi:DEAD/DEAH box helicase [Mesoterricola silvestris]|uniref:DEAD-box ATP-dependent RNA helicase RhpA n=1 Tax=Mesoterricola silvestris TaxID=2927979 RepID=A0AA48K6I2_9BACT|nr:DEAD/DEAH box helicase [Mesoterricola silvestris]BDU70849.1 ATP-dependent RNA helicase RhlE [Mesoterricola silvestris]